MSNTILDSLSFLTYVRRTICEMIDSSKVEYKDELKQFITNEATDYQIMHYMMSGEVTEEKYNIQAEVRVWEAFREMMFENYTSIIEFMEPLLVDSYLFEIGPVSGFGLSSSKSILDFQIENGYLFNTIKTKNEIQLQEKHIKEVDDISYSTEMSSIALSVLKSISSKKQK